MNIKYESKIKQNIVYIKQDVPPFVCYKRNEIYQIFCKKKDVHVIDN